MENRPRRRNTRQREIILKELQKLTSHPTAVGLYRIVAGRLPRISLGTVYRNLDLLARAGVIQKLEFGSDEARFDGNTTPHDHIRCVKCGRVDDIASQQLDLLGGAKNDFHGYSVLGRRIEFFGVCPQCNQSPNQKQE
jgi:Fur family transcriptional regulator, ferric uptake regulator